MFHIVQAVVNEELQFRDDAELLPNAGAELITHLALVGIDVLYYLLGLLAGEDTEIDAAHAQVWADAAYADADQHTTHGTRLLLEDVTQFLLNEPGYFVLTGCFQNNRPSP